MAKIKFVKDEIYHIYNRGTEKRTIFLEKLDYLRFVHSLFEFNDENPASPTNIRFASRFPSQAKAVRIEKCLEVQPLNIQYLDKIKSRDPLVEILAFTLMPNHFHLLLREIKEGGIVRFMQKLGTGYAMYFNKKYDRVGTLFQGRFKARIVDTIEYLEYMLFYIHFNCLDLIEPEWRAGKVEDFQKTIRFLDTYRWSSYIDYIGQKNFPSVIQRDFILKILDGSQDHKRIVEKWLKGIATKLSSESFRDLIIE